MMLGVANWLLLGYIILIIFLTMQMFYSTLLF